MISGAWARRALRNLTAAALVCACGSEAQSPPDGATPAADATATTPDAGVDATAPGQTLVLDPASLVFVGLPVNSLRYAVYGRDPVAHLCATLIWDYSNTGHEAGAHCDDFGAMFPYVVVSPDGDGCGDLALAGNVSVDQAQGCVDFAGSSLVSIDLVDVTVDVHGDAFTGTIRASNRSLLQPPPVSLGLTYATDVPEDVYVQTGDDYSLPAWVSISRGHEAPMLLWDRCDAPICGQPSNGVCGQAFPAVRNITGGTYSGRIDVTWDGNARVYDGAARCYHLVPAPPGNDYSATFCYGWMENEGIVVAPVCLSVPFTYPTDRVVGVVDNGG